MNLIVDRFGSLPDSTLGAFSIDGRFCCFTLEDEHRDVKVAGETRIPSGRYPVKLRTVGRLHEKYAAKFTDHRGMLEICDVPNFEAVLIHIGNTDRDSAGCVLLGDMAIATGELGNSTQAYRRAYAQVSNALLAGEPVWLDIKE